MLAEGMEHCCRQSVSPAEGHAGSKGEELKMENFKLRLTTFLHSTSHCRGCSGLSLRTAFFTCSCSSSTHSSKSRHDSLASEHPSAFKHRQAACPLPRECHVSGLELL